ncbi:hypothetical protein CXB51_003327 [Gossypium anomalum]|uniref:RNase H type-1 domain-containing protein n=1 Tax=Gossypium anomalum TaxID=47600 RepID=A0A8J5ZPF6_9ROSI|nr:hypothetical protein CXB51_003327 [Gossypium anomalum]
MGDKRCIDRWTLLEVAELICNDERKWNREVIVNTFPEEAAENILCIPLAKEPHTDFRENYLVFEQWLTRILVDQPTSLCRLFCCTLWAIWGDRNARIHDKTNKSSQEIACFVHSYLKEVDGLESTTSTDSKENTKWKHPPGQSVKINFDGAYKERNRQSASGIVVRNSEGFVLLSCTEIHCRIPSAFAVELQSRSSRVRLEFTPRSANGLAHTLATESLRRKEEMYRLKVFPCMLKFRGKSTVKENRTEERGRRKKEGSLNGQIKSIGGLKLPLENGIAIKSELKEMMEMAGVSFLIGQIER